MWKFFKVALLEAFLHFLFPLYSYKMLEALLYFLIKEIVDLNQKSSNHRLDLHATGSWPCTVYTEHSI